MPIKEWDAWMLFFATNGLDSVTRGDWEKSICDSEDIPSFDSLKSFLSNRIRALQTSTTISTRKGPQQLGPPTRKTIRSLATGTQRRCPGCDGDHILHCCTRPSAEINTVIRRLRYCFNCLQAGHRQMQCPSQKCCHECSRRHHTILHRSFAPKRSTPSSDEYQPRKRTRSNTQDVASNHLDKDANTQ